MSLDKLSEIYDEDRESILLNEKDFNFPDFIRTIRIILGMKLSVVAGHLGLTRFQLYRMESGNLKAPLDNARFESLGKLYDIPPCFGHHIF